MRRNSTFSSVGVDGANLLRITYDDEQKSLEQSIAIVYLYMYIFRIEVPRQAVVPVE